MTYGGLVGGWDMPATTKHKIFISYHHRGDQHYYDAFSKAFHKTYEVIYDNSLERQIESNDVEYVMRCIREKYLTGSSCTIVLVGNVTWGRKYVDWEIKATLDKSHGLIGVQLPTAQRTSDNKIVVPHRLYDNIQPGFALWVTWQELTASGAQLQKYIDDAKSRSTNLIVNSRELRLRNN